MRKEKRKKQPKRKPLDLKTITACLGGAACGLLVTAAGQLQTKEAEPFIHTLNRPLPLPPLWVFLLCWALFFLLTGMVTGYIAIKKTAGKKKRLALLCLQMLLPHLWPLCTFKIGSLELALLAALLLLVLTVQNAIALFKAGKKAFYLHLYCPVFILFATLLTAFFMWLN